MSDLNVCVFFEEKLGDGEKRKEKRGEEGRKGGAALETCES